MAESKEKPKKMLIGVPHYADIPPRYVISIMNMALYLVQELRWNVNTMYSEGSIISQQRNKIAKTAAEEKYDYLFFPDADTKFAPQEIKKLLDVDKEVVGGLYYARRPRHRPIVFKQFDGLHYIGMTQYDIDQKDEIGRLACTFNRMIESLKRSRDEIEEYNRNLEQKIIERTLALEEVQSQLIQSEKMSAIGQLL